MAADILFGSPASGGNRAMGPRYLLISALMFGLGSRRRGPVRPRPTRRSRRPRRPKWSRALGQKLKSNYVFPDVAERTSAALDANSAKGAYANANTAKEFAKLLTSDLRDAGQRPALGRALRAGRDDRGARRHAQSAPVGEDARRDHSRWLRHRARRAAPRQCRLPRPARIRPHGNGRRCVHVRDVAARRHRCADPGPAPQRRRRTRAAWLG